jgi:hypothetical protein
MVDWERNWRGNGVISAVLFLIAVILFGGRPRVGGSQSMRPSSERVRPRRSS